MTTENKYKRTENKYKRAAETLRNTRSAVGKTSLHYAESVAEILVLADLAAQLPEGEAERLLRAAVEKIPPANGYTVWRILGRVELWNTGCRPSVGELLFTGTYEQCKTFSSEACR